VKIVAEPGRATILGNELMLRLPVGEAPTLMEIGVTEIEADGRRWSLVEVDVDGDRDTVTLIARRLA
jgi:hypothetical protein